MFFSQHARWLVRSRTRDHVPKIRRGAQHGKTPDPCSESAPAKSAPEPLARCRRRLGGRIQWRAGFADIKRTFAKAADEAGLPEVTPHTLKHTAITWAMQNGVKIWEAAGFFATSQETIERVYGHHSPSFMESSRQAMERPRK